jgi:hypothetical protein
VKDREAKKSKEEGDEEEEEKKEKNGGEDQEGMTSGGLDLLTLLKVPSAENFKNRNKVEPNTFSSFFSFFEV